jgi:hypothetical protein
LAMGRSVTQAAAKCRRAVIVRRTMKRSYTRPLDGGREPEADSNRTEATKG